MLNLVAKAREAKRQERGKYRQLDFGYLLGNALRRPIPVAAWRPACAASSAIRIRNCGFQMTLRTIHPGWRC